MMLVKLSIQVCLVFSMIFLQNHGTSFKPLYPILNEYVKDFPKEFRKIPEDRRYRLNELVYFLEEQERNNAPLQLVFLSTNQSSVSHMAQVWSKTAAYHFGFSGFESYSAGIKPHDISVKTIMTLEKSGFIVYKTDVNNTGVYKVKYSYNLKPIVLFSKKNGHVRNPNDNFMAVFVDKNADMNTQNIRGTYNRLLLNYEDPVGYEGSDQEDQVYEESCRQLAVEMFYVFSQLRKRLKDN